MLVRVQTAADGPQSPGRVPGTVRAVSVRMRAMSAADEREAVTTDGPVFICGGDETPGPRETECQNALHDHPLPVGYVDAQQVAARRLRTRWYSKRCPDCRRYGWIAP